MAVQRFNGRVGLEELRLITLESSAVIQSLRNRLRRRLSTVNVCYDHPQNNNVRVRSFTYMIVYY